MKTIFIIDGTSGGTCKLDLINYVSNCFVKSGILKKSSTRPRRPEEKPSDLKFMDNETFDSFNFDFQYPYEGHKYGFSKKEVEELLTKVDNLFVVIRNVDLIQDFSQAFSYYKIVTVFIYTDFDVVSKRIPSASTSLKKKSIFATFQDYLRHPDFYDEIIINGGTINDFNHLLDLLVTKYLNQKNEITLPQVSENRKEHNAFFQLSKTIVGRMLLPAIIGAFSTVLMHKFLTGQLTITNPYLLQTILISASLLAYFVPQLLLSGLIKSKEQFEKNKIWYEFTYVILAIIAYIIIIVYYTTKYH